MRALRWMSFLVIVLIASVIIGVFTLETAAVIFIVAYAWNVMIFFPVVEKVVEEYGFLPIILITFNTCVSLAAAYLGYGIVISGRDFSWLLMAKAMIHPFVVWQYFILPLILRKMSDSQKNKS